MDNGTIGELRAGQDERMGKSEVLEIAYHRNGVGGDGFYVALVRVPDLDQKVLVVIVPGWAVEVGTYAKAAQRCPTGCVPAYAIDPEIASGPWRKPGTVAFGVNSWRGEYYFDLVVAAAKEPFEEPKGVTP